VVLGGWLDLEVFSNLNDSVILIVSPFNPPHVCSQRDGER